MRLQHSAPAIVKAHRALDKEVDKDGITIRFSQEIYDEKKVLGETMKNIPFRLCSVLHLQISRRNRTELLIRLPNQPGIIMSKKRIILPCFDVKRRRRIFAVFRI
jgi:hypothetical protein